MAAGPVTTWTPSGIGVRWTPVGASAGSSSRMSSERAGSAAAGGAAVAAESLGVPRSDEQATATTHRAAIAGARKWNVVSIAYYVDRTRGSQSRDLRRLLPR